MSCIKYSSVVRVNVNILSDQSDLGQALYYLGVSITLNHVDLLSEVDTWSDDHYNMQNSSRVFCNHGDVRTL